MIYIHITVYNLYIINETYFNSIIFFNKQIGMCKNVIDFTNRYLFNRYQSIDEMNNNDCYLLHLIFQEVLTNTFLSF